MHNNQLGVHHARSFPTEVDEWVQLGACDERVLWANWIRADGRRWMGWWEMSGGGNDEWMMSAVKLEVLSSTEVMDGSNGRSVKR